MTITIINEDTGAVYEFPSQEAFDAALDFYNDTSKADLIAWYIANDTACDGAIWADADCTTLAADWADVVCAKHAGGRRVR
jgi:hypothetical protein